MAFEVAKSVAEVGSLVMVAGSLVVAVVVAAEVDSLLVVVALEEAQLVAGALVENQSVEFP